MEHRPRLTDNQYRRHLEIEAGHNVLVIGDLHAPFIRKDYLEHCIKAYHKYACDEVVFIGDIIDNHYSSYHETDPDGYGAGEELDRAVDTLKPWYEAFPVATVTLGNHDLIIARKAYSSGLSKLWLRDYNQVLGTPGWRFVEQYEKDNVLYTHGTGKKCRARIKAELFSVVQGHYHSEMYIDYNVGRNYKIFGMQIGCGVDEKSYAMAYGKGGPRMAIGCGVVLDSGRLPVLEPMEL